MKNRIYFLFAVLLVLVQSCIQPLESDLDKIIERDDQILKNFISTNNIQATETAVGFYYNKEVTNDVGNQFANRDIIGIYYEIKTLEGRLIDSYLDESKAPKLFYYNEGGLIPKAINFAASVAKVGETLILYVPSYLGYQEFAFGQDIPANANLIIRVKYAKTYTLDDIKILEDQLMEEYIAINNLNGFTKSPEGIYIRTTQEGNAGAKAAGNGDQIRFNYNFGQLDSPTPLITSNPSTPFQITLGLGSNQQFLNLGMRGVRKGQKIEFLVPHDQGFGITIQVLPDIIRKELVEKALINSINIVRPFEPIVFKADIVEVN
jgi:FKBP-type peptidyl-prolyl cis-trans isomerase